VVVDTDGDGISDSTEQAIGTDPANSDSDGDGLVDGDELAGSTSPLTADSDRDGVFDGGDSSNSPSTRFGSSSTGNDVEPNDSFEQAVVLSNQTGTRISLRGNIDLAFDVDVFRLGDLFPGDRISLSIRRTNPAFRPLAALFDGQKQLFWVIEGGGLRGAALETQLTRLQIRHGPESYYLAITRAHDQDTIGNYEVEISIEPADPPKPRPQQLYLDFDGGELDAALLGVRTVNPFDAADISPAFARRTQQIKEVVIETVRERFAEFNVTILTSEDGPPPLSGVSTILFGEFNHEAFGAAPGVDSYNLDSCDDGIVYVESFLPIAFGFTPSAALLGVAIGNVAAHEAGHLLGLHHVTDSADIMDERSPAITLLQDQSFHVAPLAASVFPIGEQNAPLLLAETVGPR